MVITDRILLNKDGPKTVVRYKDGSTKKGHVWIHVEGSNCVVARSLRTFLTLFQVELYAIEVCARENPKKCFKGAQIYMGSDSQAAVGALNGISFESKLVLGRFNALNSALAALNSLDSRNRV